MEESFVQDPNITPTAYAKTIAKTSKAFNLAWVQAMNPLVEYNIMGRIMIGPELEQLLANHFMEDGLFQYINDRIGSWAGRLQKACEENPTTTMVQLLQGRSPGWWAWSLSRGFLGAPFQAGNVAPVSLGVSEMRKMAAKLDNLVSKRSGDELCDLVIVHAHNLVQADWEGEQSKVDPAFFYWGKWKDTRLRVTNVIVAFGEGCIAFEDRMEISLAPESDDQITNVSFEMDQNEKHALLTLKRIMDWIQHDLGLWGYLSTQSFLDNLYWPIKRMYLKLLDIKAKLDEPPPEMVYEDSDSNVTQDPGLGHGSPRDHEMTDATRSSDHDVNQNQPLDPDMTAYRFDPFSRNVKVDSLIENQSVLETLKKIISDSLTQQMEAQYFTTEWFVGSSNKASVWQNYGW